MAKLLYQAKAHRVGPGYASELSVGMGEVSGTGCLPLNS